MFGEMQDTDARGQARYFERLAKLSPAERARLIGAASARMRMFVRAGLARDYPDASEEELRARLAVRLYGRHHAERMCRSIPPDAT